MPPNASNPASAAAATGSGVMDCGYASDPTITRLEPNFQEPSAAVAQARIEFLHGDIYHNVSALQVQLDCAIAMGFAADTTGLLYSLRRAKAYWRAISGSAAELVAADAERLSALRQREASP